MWWVCRGLSLALWLLPVSPPPRLFTRQIDKNGTGSHIAAIRPPTAAVAALRKKHPTLP